MSSIKQTLSAEGHALKKLLWTRSRARPLHTFNMMVQHSRRHGSDWYLS
jgi:hypothetical protein